MEWTAIGIGIGWAAWEAYKYFFTKKDSSHEKLDKTRSDIIGAYETRIRQLEEQHTENELRITALEQEVLKQTKIMEKQKEYIESLIELVQGRDPAIQELLVKGNGALQMFETDTAPKVSEIHKHIVEKGGV